MKMNTTVAAVLGVGAWALVILSFWGAVLYTIYHFVSKYW